ncbi:MAG TPA: nuclear transport factor 2 family protein [Miltoncostaeaceae bacterium]|nr:nuclear transport factor 2 family protein [Miltoncostaeaceae bacterium]
MSGSGARLRGFLEAYGRGDLGAVRAALAPGLVAHVTTADGGADRVEGRDAYLARLPDLRAAGGSLEVTQVLEVEGGLVLAMVEIRAERLGDRLHNHAAFLARLGEAGITHLWMVEAQPAHSDEFWS